MRWLWVLLVCLVPRLASAHEVGLSRGSYRADGSEVKAELWFASSEVSAALAEQLATHLRVRSSDVDCPATGHRVVSSSDGQGVSLQSSFQCPPAVQSALVFVDIFDALPRGHRHLAEVQTQQVLLSDAQRVTRVVVDGKPAAFVASSLLGLGLEHILTGYDHLLFLLGLVLVRVRLRELVKVISAFTLAHSLTLACAALQLWAPPARFVEPGIALSIAFVGWENLRTRRPAYRSWLTFGFGLVHGFGFAGALLDMKLPAERLPIALLSFNLGVELGQLLVASAAWLLLGALRRRQTPAVTRSAELLLNGGVLAAGLVWLVVRVRAGYLT